MWGTNCVGLIVVGLTVVRLIAVRLIVVGSIDVGLIDQSIGNENIYLKGGEGIISTLDLFSGSITDDSGEEISEFDHFKQFFYDEVSDEPIRIVNEAYIEFFVNQNFSNDDEPERIYIYNYEQNTALIDYFLDQSVSSLTINAKINHLEPLVRDSLDDNKGIIASIAHHNDP